MMCNSGVSSQVKSLHNFLQKHIWKQCYGFAMNYSILYKLEEGSKFTLLESMLYDCYVSLNEKQLGTIHDLTQSNFITLKYFYINFFNY